MNKEHFYIREVAKANLERIHCADGHENDDFDTIYTMASTLKLPLTQKAMGVKNPTFYVLDLICLS